MEQQPQTWLAEAVKSAHGQVNALFDEIARVIVGQRTLVERLFMGLILDGHVLVEGAPGLAKTTAVKALAAAVSASFQRIQFTPDLLPADIIGTQIYNPKTQEFFIKRGPLFHNIILADEINRAPAKVQSALLEAMQERQVTIGEETFQLERPFIVLATQNPIEQEGTYPLPEAQLDRFLLKVVVQYPSREEEMGIINRFAVAGTPEPKSILNLRDLAALQDLVKQIYIDPKINKYIVDLVFATREPPRGKSDLNRLIRFGGSPRASLCLNMASRCHAFLRGRHYVVPQDVKAVACEVLRHRLILSYEAESEDITTDDVIKRLLEVVDVP